MILQRSIRSSRRYHSDESDPSRVEIRWSRSLGGFRRDGELVVDGKELELRTEKQEVWLVDGEESIAYAQGTSTRWELTLEDRGFLLTQPALGKLQSTLMEGETVIGEVRSADKLMKKVLVNVSDEFSSTQKAFVAAIVIRSWRETLAGISHAAGGLS